jgi:DNA (cytosine-5)-methyltransferase 1
MRYLSVCSGIEAATVAWHPLGWEPVAFAEIERFPSAVLKHHYPTVKNLGDMNEHAKWALEAIDLLVGGTPCQSFSVAGLRQGLADPRGGLMLRFLEIARSHRPRWVVWENVPGVLSSNGGRDFGTLLGGLEELGYGWAYRILDAQFFGVAQRRRRVFVVGCAGDQRRAGSVLFDRESMCRHPAKSAAQGKDAAPAVAGCLGSRMRKDELDGHGAYVMDAVTQYGPNAGTLTARYDSSRCADRGQNVVAFPSRLSSTQAQETMRPNISPALTRLNPIAVAMGRRVVGTVDASVDAKWGCQQWVDAAHYAYGHRGPRRLTPREYERLQGFPDDYTLIPYRRKAAEDCPDGPRYKALGNSMAVPCMRWIGERIAAAN